MSNKIANSEVDLIAFISLLSVLICSLLLTAVWVQIGTMDVKQALGGEASPGPAEPSLYVKIDEKGTVRLDLQDAPKKLRKLRSSMFKAKEGKINIQELHAYLSNLKNKLPNFKTALIQPKKDVVYEDIISLMDEFKKVGISDLGIVPL